MIGCEVECGGVVDFLCGDSSSVLLSFSGFQVLGACCRGWYSCYVVGVECTRVSGCFIFMSRELVENPN